MAEIRDPVLRVERVEGAEGLRRLVVEFTLVEGPDPGRGEPDVAVVVRAIDLGDAPVPPRQLHAELAQDGPPTSNGAYRFVADVPRVDLDVEQDWWRTGPGGEIEPIGEFVDHLHGVVTVHRDGRLVAEGETPVVSASWGVLGGD